jgi:hypothetical protein
MVWVIAFSSPDSFVISSISLCDQNYSHLSNLFYRDKSCCRDNVNRAAGQRAVVMVFASPSGQSYLDVTTPFHLSGLSRLDNFIVTRKSCPLTGTLQKRMPTPTQTATPHTTGPLGLRETPWPRDGQRIKARVWLTPNTCFFQNIARYQIKFH